MAGLLLSVLFLVVLVWEASSLDNGLALTPPMGFSTWNTLRCDYTETDLFGIADALVSSGMRDAGYRFLNIDDCWMSNSRDPNTGLLTWNATRFPSGAKALADYIHAKGLLFGLYSSSGPYTCEGFPGSWKHEQVDAAQFAKWEVDFLKLDACVQFSVQDRRIAFEAMSKALLSTGRPILFSCDSDELILSENNAEFPYQWAPPVCNMARINWDIWDSWRSISEILTSAQNVGHSSQPGYFNDLDILVVGMGGMSLTEYISHFQLWCLFSSPLIAGNDIRNMSQEIQAVLTNHEAIAINQDKLGRAANMIRRGYLDGTTEVWAKPLWVPDSEHLRPPTYSSTTTITSSKLSMIARPPCKAIPTPVFHPWPLHAVVLFNRATIAQDIFLDFADLFDHKLNPHPPSPPWHAMVRDVWNHADLGVFLNNFTATRVPAHGSVMLTVHLQSSEIKTASL